MNQVDCLLAQIAPNNLPLFVIPCLNDQTKKQISAMNAEVLDSMFTRSSVAVDERQRISTLFQEGDMARHDIKAKILAEVPDLATVVKSWTASQMQHFTLTSVGMAIGHANLKRYIGEFASLSIWIN